MNNSIIGLNLQPSLINNNGVLNEQWVVWYMNTAQVELSNALRHGANLMLEMQQRMIGFQREMLVSPDGVRASYAHLMHLGGHLGQYQYGRRDMEFATNPTPDQENWRKAYLAHLEETGRYLPGRDEPSPFYAPVDTETLAVYLANDPWLGWYFAQEANRGATINQQTVDEFKQRLETQPRFPTKVGMPQKLTVVGRYLSLSWVLYMADHNPEKTLQEIHDMGMEQIKLHANNQATYGGLQPPIGPHL